MVESGMALSIKDNETERLARQVAKETDESLTEAIRRSLKERLQRLRRKNGARLTREKLNDIFRRIDALPNLDTRTEDEILDYDEHGLPR
jgi:antitoxin VapB